jgi:hypothetical protein
MKGLEKYKEKIQFIHGHPDEPHLDCDHWSHEILLSRVPCNATCDAIQLCENNSCCLLPVDIFSCRVMIRKKTWISNNQLEVKRKPGNSMNYQ